MITEQKILDTFSELNIVVKQISTVTDPFDNSVKWNVIVYLTDDTTQLDTAECRAYFISDEETLKYFADSANKEVYVPLRRQAITRKALERAASTTSLYKI